LLRAAFAALAARGVDHVRLNVDADNETGATRLYASVGMTVRRAFLVYEKRLDPGVSSAP
jgi:ribosomal protein S18 acetylase RimI-like enzyme